MINANARPYLLLMIFLAMAVCEPLQAANGQVHVIPASELKQWWQAPPGHPNAPPPYPINVAQAGVAGCVAVAFEIHGDGSVSNERVWHSTLTNAHVSKQFEQAILRAVHQWRFVPAAANVGHDSVYTYQVFTFALTRLSSFPAGMDPIPNESDRRRADHQAYELKAKCEIANFPQQVQTMINAGAKTKGGKT